MEVHLPQNQEAKLNDLAVQTGRQTDDLVQEAVARMLAHNDWFKAQVQIGIDQIATSSKRITPPSLNPPR
jgi:predicted transcriptional regulator